MALWDPQVNLAKIKRAVLSAYNRNKLKAPPSCIKCKGGCEALDQSCPKIQESKEIKKLWHIMFLLS
jgi:hypothetical protein